MVMRTSNSFSANASNLPFVIPYHPCFATVVAS